MGIAGWQTKYSLNQKLTTVLPENEPRAAPLLRYHLWVAIRDRGSSHWDQRQARWCSRTGSLLQTSEFHTVIASSTTTPTELTMQPEEQKESLRAEGIFSEP